MRIVGEIGLAQCLVITVSTGEVVRILEVFTRLEGQFSSATVEDIVAIVKRHLSWYDKHTSNVTFFGKTRYTFGNSLGVVTFEIFNEDLTLEPAKCSFSGVVLQGSQFGCGQWFIGRGIWPRYCRHSSQSSPIRKSVRVIYYTLQLVPFQQSSDLSVFNVFCFYYFVVLLLKLEHNYHIEKCIPIKYQAILG